MTQDDLQLNFLSEEPPCQSFSVAGLRKGMADPRGNLALEFLRLADVARPRWIVWENVPGVLSSNGGRDFAAFLTALGQLGYGWAYRVLDAQYFGVPQRRRRVFVVGHLGDWRSAAAVLFESHSLRGNSAPSRETGKGTSRGIEIGPSGIKPTNTAPTLDARCKDGPIRNQIGLAISSIDLYNGKIDPDTFPAVTSRTGIPDATGPRLFTPHVEIFDMRGRGDGNISPTLCTDHAGKASDYCPVLTKPQAAVRRLTPRECERLQGFPDDYTRIQWRNKSAEECPDGPRYKAIGNSMAVPVMAWIGNRIQMVEDISK